MWLQMWEYHRRRDCSWDTYLHFYWGLLTRDSKHDDLSSSTGYCQSSGFWAQYNLLYWKARVIGVRVKVADLLEWWPALFFSILHSIIMTFMFTRKEFWRRQRIQQLHSNFRNIPEACWSIFMTAIIISKNLRLQEITDIKFVITQISIYKLCDIGILKRSDWFAISD